MIESGKDDFDNDTALKLQAMAAQIKRKRGCGIQAARRIARDLLGGRSNLPSLPSGQRRRTNAVLNAKKTQESD